MKTLLINAHPQFNNQQAFAVQLTNKAQSLIPADDLTVLNLFDTEILELDDTLLTIWNKFATGETLTESEQKIATQSAELLNQFKAHKRIIIAMPLHNFNISARMKRYLDHILVPRETYKYVSGGGSVGLMTDGRKLLVLQSSGSIYTDGGRYQPLDFSVQYLKEMFCNIMGFEGFDVVRLQGTSVSAVDNEQALAAALKEIEEKVPAFLSAK